MPAPSLSVFINPLLSLNSIQLGRLVLDVHNPWQDFSPFESISFTRDDIITNSSLRVCDILDASKGTRFHLHLTRFLTSFYETNQDAVSHIVTSEAKSYLLPNSRLHLARICKDKDTREWLETVIKEGWDAYMIVGIHTIKDAEITVDHKIACGTKASGQLPVGSLAAAVGVPGHTVDMEISGEKHVRCGGTSGFVAPGEQVIAIQYRKLKFKWLFSSLLESTYLEEGNRWKVYLPGDKAEPEEGTEDDEDVVEVEFEEEIGAIDVEGNHEGFIDHDVCELFLVQ